METDCRHVAPNDDNLTARMRFHQSWYRRHALGLPPGPNPAARGACYGSMLTADDGAAGHNFLTPVIHAHTEQRLAQGGGVEPRRLRCNLLSSQPMCFNLFAPLAADLALATRLVAALPGLPAGLRVTAVKLEYAPDKARHLNDNTAFDAFIEFEHSSGGRGFIGVEAKLTERFSSQPYAFAARYSRWQQAAGWWWRAGSESEFSSADYNQLWRNHLLAFAMLRQQPADYALGYCAVLGLRQNVNCAQAMAGYRAILQDDARATLLTWHLDDLVAAWELQVQTQAERAWLAAFRRRYLDLTASEAAWQVFQGG